MRRQSNWENSKTLIKIMNQRVFDLKTHSLLKLFQTQEKIQKRISKDVHQIDLFIGVIDINKCEEDARSLYNKLLNEGDNFSTAFWCGFRSVELKRNIINLPSTVEELKEAQRVCSDVSRALDCYNEFMPKIQYFKPHTANAKRFLNNAEFINRQLNLYNESKESISSFLGIEEKEFSKLIRYYSKPRVNSIKNFIEKQTDKARYDSEIAEELKKFMKTKIRQWI